MYTANLPTTVVDFRGFDSSVILNLRGGILRYVGQFPENLSQAMLVGIMLVGSLGVISRTATISLAASSSYKHITLYDIIV